ncbi:hypothetical protein AND_010604 [Anopheles darlingi]|uniref:Uncharacterized protein n=1 Tax=Anopheles darlingi TaxID=43151 RepID=W5J267_ANODA|nr:hypothetical protein AND_010604 [Anopheles darlingi]
MGCTPLGDLVPSRYSIAGMIIACEARGGDDFLHAIAAGRSLSRMSPASCKISSPSGRVLMRREVRTGERGGLAVTWTLLTSG